MNENSAPDKLQDRTRRRASRTREKLLDAALSAFNEIGIDLTSIQDITERADVGKGTFYRHFEDKPALLRTLMDRAVAHLVERIKQATPTKGATLEAVLGALLDTHMEFFVQHGQEYLLLFQGPVMLRMKRKLAEGLEQPFAFYLTALEQQLAPALTQPTDAVRLRRLAVAVAGFTLGFFAMAMIGMQPEEIAASAQALKRAFLAGAPGLLA